MTLLARYGDILQPGVESNYSYFPVVIDPKQAGFDRNQLMEYLEEQGIGSRNYFSPLTSSFPCYQRYACTDTPIADRISQQVLTLPMYAELTLDEVDYICDSIYNFRKAKR